MEPSPATLTHENLADARARVGEHVPVSAAIRWPLLEEITGTETWVKHENHNPTGAFKVRGGINFLGRLAERGELPRGIIAATRGNHGQSAAYAGALHELPVTIVVPHGNSPDKNAAMAGFGAEVLVHGRDFQEAREYAGELARERGLLPLPAYHPWLMEGVATYAAELHEQVPGLDTVYVPVGMGTGICGNIAVRDLLKVTTEVVGVVADRAPAYALSHAAGHPVDTDSADTFIDGVACRTPDPAAVADMRGASRFVRVSEQQAADAMAVLYCTTHNLPEPAAAIATAALLTEKERQAGRRVAVVMSGGNCDWSVLSTAMGTGPTG